MKTGKFLSLNILMIGLLILSVVFLNGYVITNFGFGSQIYYNNTLLFNGTNQTSKTTSSSGSYFDQPLSNFIDNDLPSTTTYNTTANSTANSTDQTITNKISNSLNDVGFVKNVNRSNVPSSPSPSPSPSPQSPILYTSPTNSSSNLESNQTFSMPSIGYNKDKKSITDGDDNNQRGEYLVDNNGIHYYNINNCSEEKGSSGIGDLSECEDAERELMEEN